MFLTGELPFAFISCVLESLEGMGVKIHLILIDKDGVISGFMLTLTMNAAVTHRQQGNVGSECIPWRLR